MRLLTLGLVMLVVYAFWGGQVKGQEGAPPGVVGDTYTSPVFGYSLSWDGDYWELQSAASSDDDLSDRVELDVRGEPLSRLFIDGFMWNREGDPHDAAGWVEKKFAEMAASVDDDSVISDLKQAEAGGKPIGGHDETSAYAVYEYRYLGSQLAAYYDCRELIQGVAGLCSWFVTPRDQFNSQVPHVREVLDTLTAATVNPCALLPVGTPSLIDPRAAATPTTASGCAAT